MFRGEQRQQMDVKTAAGQRDRQPRRLTRRAAVFKRGNDVQDALCQRRITYSFRERGGWRLTDTLSIRTAADLLFCLRRTDIVRRMPEIGRG